jgi:hypothetical protein
MRARCPAHLILLDLTILKFGEAQKLWSRKIIYYKQQY